MKDDIENQALNLSERERGWLAAAIDCECTLTLSNSLSKNRRERHFPQPLLRFDSVDKPLAIKFCRIVGGQVRQHPASPNGRQAVYRVGLYRQKLLAKLLEQLLPELIAKHREAQLIKRWIELRSNYRQNRDVATGRIVTTYYSKQEKAEYLDIYREMRSLNGFKGRKSTEDVEKHLLSLPEMGAGSA